MQYGEPECHSGRDVRNFRVLSVLVLNRRGGALRWLGREEGSEGIEKNRGDRLVAGKERDEARRSVFCH